jgi:hypothetical protein
VGEALGSLSLGTVLAGLDIHTISAMAGGAVTAVMRGGRVAAQQVAVDVFGNAIGQSLTDSSSSAQGAGPYSDVGYRNGSDINSDSYRAAGELRYRNGMDIQSDVYTPTSGYGYRNGLDIQADRAWDERVTRQLQGMNIPDYAQKMPKPSRRVQPGPPLAIVWDGGAGAGRGFVNPADAYLFGQPFAGRSTVTDPADYVTDQQRYRRLIEMSREGAEDHSVSEWDAAAAEYKQLSGTSFTRDSIYNGLWTKAAQLRMAAGGYSADISNNASAVAIEAGAHAEFGVGVVHGLGPALGVGALRNAVTGRFMIDPDYPPSPYEFNDAQRRAAWREIANNPNSPLTAAERVEVQSRGWRGPQRVNQYGEIETMELSHEPIPLREGGTQVVPRWPDDHASVDPFRQLKKRP